jgi:hypothetical protein
VNSAHYSQLHFAFDGWMDEIFNELVSYFNLKVKMTKQLRMLLGKKNKAIL